MDLKQRTQNELGLDHNEDEKKKMKCKHREYGKMFSSDELRKLYNEGQLKHVFETLPTIVHPDNLIASANDTSVFKYDKNGEKYVVKVAPRNIRFFKHFGKNHSARDFKKYINRLDPFFLPVDEILYEDDNVFVYSQKKCRIIKSKNVNRRIVCDIFRLVQFMLVNDILLTDLAPHNLGYLDRHVVVFDYHGLHRLTKHGTIKRENWWRRLIRNMTRFITALFGSHKRSEYSKLMQNCDDNVVKKLENDPDIPKPFSKMVKYITTAQNHVSIEKLCGHLEENIQYLKSGLD